MPSLSRQQLIAWSAVGLVILLIGANYLRGHLQANSANAVVTVALKEETNSTRIKVHLTGAVARPGLYELEPGIRVADALEQAGGPTPQADLTRINLAAKLADGQQLIVPQQGAAGPAAASAPGQAGNHVNLNAATLEELMELDGVGPKTAQKIIAYREEHGGFKSVDELQEVPGIGSAKFDQIKDQVTI